MGFQIYKYCLLPSKTRPLFWLGNSNKQYCIGLNTCFDVSMKKFNYHFWMQNSASQQNNILLYSVISHTNTLKSRNYMVGLKIITESSSLNGSQLFQKDREQKKTKKLMSILLSVSYNLKFTLLSWNFNCTNL